MNQYSEARSAYPTSVRMLDAARAIECVALVSGAGVVVATLALPGTLLAAAMLGIAAVLRPRERVLPAVVQLNKRRDLLGRLSAEALALRLRYSDVHKLPLGHARSEAMWAVRRDITIWLDTGLKGINRYPEVAGIIRSRRTTGGLVDELDSALQRLADVRRLLSVSERRNLPF